MQTHAKKIIAGYIDDLLNLLKGFSLLDCETENRVLVILFVYRRIFVEVVFMRPGVRAGAAFAHEKEIMKWLFDEHKEVTQVKKMLAAGIAFSVAIASLTGCTKPADTPAITPTPAEIGIEQTGYTFDVPSDYTKASSHPGTVVRVDYDSEDYVRGGGAITKTAYVYTPYGYNENDTDTKYNILYLMHGWGGHAYRFQLVHR